MRIKATDPMAEHVLTILLDGKPVPMPYEADDKENWVTSYVPVLPSQLASNGDETIEEQITEWKLVTKYGATVIKFKANAPSMGSETIL